METLYHYCGLDAMLAILRTRSVWLSNSENMNDRMESKWSDPLFFEGFKRYQPFLSKDTYELALQFYNFTKPRPFIFCLSSSPDVLSQWRAYADDGAGVALGFSPEALSPNRHEPVTSFDARRSTTLCQVTYDAAAQQEKLDGLFVQAFGEPGPEVARIDHWVVVNSMNAFASMTATFKNPAFREEKEWRLVHTPFIRPPEPDFKIFGSNLPLEHRISQGVLQSFFVMKFENPGFLKEIWLGPKCRASDFDLNLLLETNEIKGVTIHRSTASYR